MAKLHQDEDVIDRQREQRDLYNLFYGGVDDADQARVNQPWVRQLQSVQKALRQLTDLESGLAQQSRFEVFLHRIFAKPNFQ